MQHLGIQVNIKNQPELDPEFIPYYKFNESFLKNAKKPIAIAIERNDKQIHVKETFIHSSDDFADADLYYLERLIKFELWQKGGFRIYTNADDSIFQELKKLYAPGGSGEFEADFMSLVYQKEFEVIKCDKMPEPYGMQKTVGGHFGGCRIGVDFGGSDYKVAAVIDGEAVYSSETVWNPKINSDPDYHLSNVTAAMKEAAAHLPRVDAIGVSSAGLIGNNRVLYAQLYGQVPKEHHNSRIRDIYFHAAEKIGKDIPLEVANDGDVAVLAGAIGLNRNNIVGLALGTSFAGGFIDSNGNLTTWINELGFTPVDVSPNASKDEWTGDIGIGVQYFSQEAVIKLAPAAGIELDKYETPAEKLKAVQNLLNEEHKGAAAIFRTIGCYLGHTIPLYYDVYKAENYLLLGRTVSGRGGDIIQETALKVIKEEYPDIKADIILPDEKTRRMGQSVAAASLPKI